MLFSPARANCDNEVLTSTQSQAEPLLQEFPLCDRTITAEGPENFDEDEQPFMSVDFGSNDEDDDEVASFFEEAAAAISATPGRQLGPAGSGRPQADFTLLERTPGVTAYPVSVSRFAQTHSISVMLVGEEAVQV